MHDVVAGRPPHPHGIESRETLTAIVEIEWLEGETLAAACRGRPAPEHALAARPSWIADLCDAVDQLHSTTRMQGNPTVHRDLSPSNCMITADRGVVLVDLGGMQLAVDAADLDGRHTPAFSAPEVLARPHAPRSAAADRFALGAIAYFCLTEVDPSADR